MRKCLLVCLTVLALAGCGKKAPLPPGAAVAPPPQVAGVNYAAPVAFYEGRTAEQWAAGLASPDQQVRLQASQALGAMNKDGARYLIQGMRSSSPETQLNALQAFYKPDLVKDADETMPLLMRMLENKDTELRLNAAARLPWFEAKANRAMPLLQYMAANDPSPQVRATAKESMVFINYHVTGVKPKHGH